MFSLLENAPLRVRSGLDVGQGPGEGAELSFCASVSTRLGDTEKTVGDGVVFDPASERQTCRRGCLVPFVFLTQGETVFL